MKSLKTVLTTIAITAFAGGALIAQQATTGPNGHFHRHGAWAAKVSSYLNLTDQQQQQAKAIFQEAKTSAQPVRQQLKQERQAIRAAIQAGKSPSEVQQMAQSEGPQLAQLAGIRAASFAKFYSILTPEQQQKLATMRQNMHRNHGTQTPSNS